VVYDDRAKKYLVSARRMGTPGGNEVAHGCAGGVLGSVRQLAHREKRAKARRARMR